MRGAISDAQRREINPLAFVLSDVKSPRSVVHARGIENRPIRLIGVAVATYITGSMIERAASTWCSCVNVWLVRSASELRRAYNTYVRLACARIVADCERWCGRVVGVCRADHWTGSQQSQWIKVVRGQARTRCRLSTHDIARGIRVRCVIDFTKRSRNVLFSPEPLSQTTSTYALFCWRFIRIVSF